MQLAALSELVRAVFTHVVTRKTGRLAKPLPPVPRTRTELAHPNIYLTCEMQGHVKGPDYRFKTTGTPQYSRIQQ